MSHSTQKVVVVIGGGAAGFFGAINCAQANPNCRVILLEKNRQLLSKVRISGGGRCNVTHACFDPAVLIQNYPRGYKALRGPFSRFQPKDTIQWFESRGVALKIENDGRMFPITDDSETIVQCLIQEAKKSGVEVRTECGVSAIQKEGDRFIVMSSQGENILADSLLLATGSSPKGHEWARSLGHVIEPLVPSLFTFNVPSSPLLELSGISLSKVHLKIQGSDLEQEGPLLLTHWGFSGPAVLKLSAWGARFLHDCQYQATLIVNWLPQLNEEQLRQKLVEAKSCFSSRLVSSESPVEIPKNLWKVFVSLAGISSEQRWAVLSNKQIQKLVELLRMSAYKIEGKSTYKEEFVTCGGVKLEEVNFKTMESRICPRLYFAGEILDVDGVTGGFNFQNAWTTSWIAGNTMAINSC